MEEWQRNHITKNLSQLIRDTKVNTLMKVELVAQNILDQAEVEELTALEDKHGQSKVSNHFYHLLMTRTNAYKVLTKVLYEHHQTGAARILFGGVPNNISDKPLTYLGIPITWDEFKDMEIEVNGKKLLLHEYIPNVDHENLLQIFQKTVSELEIYDTFVTKQRTFVLANKTVPPKPTIYLSRFLSNRIKIDESIFKVNCPDVFVFKNSIARYKLSQFAKPHFTDTSSSQLSKITCRFIYLDENEDWTELKTLAKAPIHLVNYEANENHFLLEDTTGASHILKKFNTEEKRVYMTEEDFVQQQLSKDGSSSSVCICDSPGMGKTFLLANIAREMAEKNAGRIIVFIQLTSFAEDCFPKSPNTIIKPETSLINVLSHIGSPQQNPQLLIELVKVKQLSLEIFFDGFDELPADKVEWTRQVFRSITTFQNVRIYITSRPHMRRGLETSLGVVAYDMLPFNQQNQVDFLVQFWINRKPDSDQLSLQSYAADCLEAVNHSLDKRDKEIAGIPLLCQLIAEVYGTKKAFRLIKRGSFRDVPIQIYGMYRKFTENKIHLVTNNTDEFENIKLVCIWHALKLLFPTNDFHKTKKFQKVKHLLISSKILKAGIFQKQSNGALEFVHRTFAEFLVAEYFPTKLKYEETQKIDEMSCNSFLILKYLLECQEIHLQYYEFVHPVMASFLNSSLGQVNFSEELIIQLCTAISSFSNEEFTSILCVCCPHNFLNIFSFLGQVLTKCNNSWILECFTHKKCYHLLSVCIRWSTSQMFHAYIQLLTDVLKLDVSQINTFDDDVTLLETAVGCANYAAVEYLMDRVPLKNQSILEWCVDSDDGDDMEKRGNILLLLLSKDPTLIHETPHILLTFELDVSAFKILVKFGANLTAVDGNNCAMHAAEYMPASDYHELVQFLLTDCKAEYLFVDHEKCWDPLHYIIQQATLLPETMELLLAIPGIDISMKDRWEESLLFSAVRADDLNELERLVDKGVDYKARGGWNRSLLHVATEYGRVEMVRYLLSLKLDPNSRDNLKRTPLHDAACYGNLSVVEDLVENGANVQAKSNWGQTALHLSAERSGSKSIEIIRYLIRKGAEVNVRDESKNTPLHLCTNKEFVDCLIEMGADISAKNNDGQTVLHVFASRYKTSDNEEETKYLIRKGLGVNDPDNYGNTPLHLYCRSKKIRDGVMELGADIHAKK